MHKGADHTHAETQPLSPTQRSHHVPCDESSPLQGLDDDDDLFAAPAVSMRGNSLGHLPRSRSATAGASTRMGGRWREGGRWGERTGRGRRAGAEGMGRAWEQEESSWCMGCGEGGAGDRGRADTTGARGGGGLTGAGVYGLQGKGAKDRGGVAGSGAGLTGGPYRGKEVGRALQVQGLAGRAHGI